MQSIFLVYSESNKRNNEEVNKIISKLEADIETNTFEDDSSIISVLEDINMIPFLASKKVVILDDPSFLYKPAEVDSKLIDSFINYLLSPVDTTILIFKITKYSKISDIFLSPLKKCANIIEAKAIKPTDGIEYIKHRFSEDMYEIEDLVPEEILSRIKNDFDRLDSELSKLEAYCLDEKRIRIKDVRDLISIDLETNVFELTNAILAHDKRKAYDIYLDLTIKNSAQSLLPVLISKFNDLYDAKKLTEQGFSKSDIAVVFGFKKEGQAYYLIKDCQQYSSDSILKTLNNLIDVDYKIKTGQLSDQIALEMFILK